MADDDLDHDPGGFLGVSAAVLLGVGRAVGETMAARPTPNRTAAETPQKAAGIVIEVVVCQSVVPSANEPLFIDSGTLVSASSATETTVSSAITPTTNPTANRLPSEESPRFSNR